jgi:DNA repair protein SbcC/Rad50
MISTEALTKEVSAKLSNARQIAPDVVRAERVREKGHPFAIYYFALSSNIQDWADRLEERQDEVLGTSYYESKGDLRWNQYLYLLTSEEAAASGNFESIKRFIESNRSYARKFVLTVDQLPAALTDLAPLKEMAGERPREDVVGRWTKRLVTGKLDVVLEQLSLVETVRAIAEGRPHTKIPSRRNDANARQPQPMGTRFLEAIEVSKFRGWPKQKLFEDLGAVNLIVGSNGVGKTSFLEAIEFFYCQENARTELPPSGAHIRGRFRGSDDWEETFAGAKVAEAKQRNLDWYGQRDLKGSTLPNSFARFNFLCTDDAAILGQKNAKLSFEDMLSRLVAGPQAAELWDHIGRLAVPVSAELSKVRSVATEAKERRATLQALIDSLAARPKGSDSDFAALVEDLQRIGWHSVFERDQVTALVVPALARASSILRELVQPVYGSIGETMTAIAASASAMESNEKVVAESLNRIDDKLEQRAAKEKEQKEIKLAIERIRAIQGAQMAGCFDASAALQTARQEREEAEQLVGRFASIKEFPGDLSNLRLPLAKVVTDVAQQVAATAQQILAADSELIELRRLQSAHSSLLQEIRELARQLVVHTPEHSDCPVCSTHFKSGELREKILAAGEVAAEDLTGPVLQRLADLRSLKGRLDGQSAWLALLKEFFSTIPLKFDDASPSDVLMLLNEERERLELSAQAEAAAKVRLQALEANGYSVKTIDDLGRHAESLKIDVRSVAEAAAVLDFNTERLTNIDLVLSQVDEEVDAMVSDLAIAVGTVSFSGRKHTELAEGFRTRLGLARRAMVLAQELKSLLVVGDDDVLASYGPRIDSARVAADRFAKALKDEREMQATNDASKESLKLLDGEIRELSNRSERLAAAVAVLDAISAHDSLASATDAELASAQIEIESVFKRIHSPNEFTVRRDIAAPLCRVATKELTTLRDISTGQRAAFVLSLFLAMNGKLKTAPPILLFDDPVAHIDDFNVLSFLDHIRDVAIGGKRQVFYATADSRLAGLFEHKLAFLGPEFRRFDLER